MRSAGRRPRTNSTPPLGWGRRTDVASSPAESGALCAECSGVRLLASDGGQLRASGRAASALSERADCESGGGLQGPRRRVIARRPVQSIVEYEPCIERGHNPRASRRVLSSLAVFVPRTRGACRGGVVGASEVFRPPKAAAVSRGSEGDSPIPRDRGTLSVPRGVTANSRYTR